MLGHVKDQIDRGGWYEMANPVMAAGYLKDLQRTWPNLRMVSNVGDLGVSEILYLPRARRTLRAMFKQQLGEALAQADRMRVALLQFE